MSIEINMPYRSGLDDLNRTWLKLVYVEKVEYSGQEWVFRKDELTRHRLVICGSPCRVIVDGVRIPAYSGTVILCRPGQWVETGGPSQEKQVMYILEFEQGPLTSDEGEQIIDAPLKHGTHEYRIADSVRIGDTIYEYWERAVSSVPSALADGMRVQASFYELLALLIEQREHRNSEAPEMAKKEIDLRYGEGLSVDELASLSGVSRYHLMRAFKERYGKSIVEYLTEVRLQQAKKLMLENGLPISDIAERVGFRSEPYFRTVFKKEVGIAPAVYLRNRRRKVAAYSWPVLGQLLPLQVVPHAAPIDHYWTDEFSRKYSSDIEVPLGHHYEFNHRALLQAKPDCIIGLDSTISQEEAVQLGKIAPVLRLPWMEAGWREHLRMAADFLGMTDHAVSWLEHYEQKAQLVQERVHNRIGNDKVLVLKVAGDEMQIWGRKAMTVLYDDLGIKPAALMGSVEWYAPVELEQLAHCEEDCRFIVSVNGDFQSQAFWKKLQTDKRWSGLRQVRQNRVHLQQGHQAWVYPWFENSALYQERQLDRLEHLILCTH
ncbi:AraC family transcriptional regulator [Paenibacillus sp. NPDC058174]|uniref:AraC family transcriptional regulator n=1 Tax=Paenibacillus sp. NPDC058174 TaxID=3346366 RepID=UPI0036D99C9B